MTPLERLIMAHMPDPQRSAALRMLKTLQRDRDDLNERLLKSAYEKELRK